MPSHPSYGVGSAQGSANSMVGSEEWRRPFSTQRFVEVLGRQVEVVSTPCLYMCPRVFVRLVCVSGSLPKC
jgi:hypothetical protein